MPITHISNVSYQHFKGDIEPPIGLNVEVDDENNSLLITWLPITLSNVASSSGTQVLGYCVYLDGVEVNVVQGAAGWCRDYNSVFIL